MATKRIFQIAKEFERDEKEIISFLTAQGIKVSNKLSAVSEEAYNMLKAKFMAPPPEPEPEPEPEPVVEEVAPAQPETPAENPQPESGGKKKKKKKNKNPQPDAAPQTNEQPVQKVSTAEVENVDKRTQSVLYEGIKAGNDFISNYNTTIGQAAPYKISKKNKIPQPLLSWNMDTWSVLYSIKFEYPDTSPMRYWQAAAKLTTRAFKNINAFGMANRELLAEMRDAMKPIGEKYKPREIFTDEENQKFEAQQKLLFVTFGHGMGLVNDNLFALKLKAEHMKVKYERMDFLEYATNPKDELRNNERAPFTELVDGVVFAMRGIARRFYFYLKNKERINKILKDFFEWVDGYAKLKEQGADAAKLEKYLGLLEKFISIAEFMSFDNLISVKKNKPQPFDLLVDLLTAYRDNLDDPDAERNCKYKVRGVINVIYKPKEYIFTYQFAELEANEDYRPPKEKTSPTVDEA